MHLLLPSPAERPAVGHRFASGHVSQVAQQGVEVRIGQGLPVEAGHLRLWRCALSPVKRVASAVSEGSMAIAFVHKFLQQEHSKWHEKN